MTMVPCSCDCCKRWRAADPFGLARDLLSAETAGVSPDAPRGDEPGVSVKG